MVTKKEIRTEKLELRANLSSEDKANFSQLVFQTIIEQPWWQHAKNIACYVATKNELDTKLLIDEIIKTKGECFLPIVQPNTRELRFANYKQGDKLNIGEYGIYTPDVNSKIIQTWDLDIIFIPVVAFSKHGQRLGMGKGYYDTTLNNLSHKPIKPLAIGLAFDIQQSIELPQDKWDVILDAVITEKELHIINKTRL